MGYVGADLRYGASPGDDGALVLVDGTALVLSRGSPVLGRLPASALTVAPSLERAGAHGSG